MFERILNQMRNKVRMRQYVMTLHAEEEMSEDGLSIFDVESVILSGKIVERQKERATAEAKYLVEGKSLGGEKVIVVARISLTGKLVFVTVYCE